MLPAPAPVPAVTTALVDTATRLCLPALGKELIWPTGVDALDKEATLLGRFGLRPGASPAAMAVMGPQGSGILPQAILAEGEASDGAYVMALGGRQATCRLIVYRLADPLDFHATLNNALGLGGWRSALSSSTAVVAKQMFIRRSSAGQPFLINVLSSTNPAQPLPIVLTIVAIPAGVALPKGF